MTDSLRVSWTGHSCDVFIYFCVAKQTKCVQGKNNCTEWRRVQGPLDPSSTPCRGRFQGRLLSVHQAGVLTSTKKLKTKPPAVRSYQLVCEIQGGPGRKKKIHGASTGRKMGKRTRVVRLCRGWGCRKYFYTFFLFLLLIHVASRIVKKLSTNKLLTPRFAPSNA